MKKAFWRTMRNACINLIAVVLLLTACRGSSNTPEGSGTAVLSIFYSNDITGYLTPCG